MIFGSKNIVITGAAGGIGRALIEAFSGAGGKIWALDRDEARLSLLASESIKLGWEVNSRCVDICDEQALSKLRDEIVEKVGQIHVWVNNAGISGTGWFSETDPAVLQRVFATNVWGSVFGTRLALEHMEEKGSGWIVNMASLAGHVGAPRLAAYSASKHAVVGFTRSLQAELNLRCSPVRLCLVSPGFVKTDMIELGTSTGFPKWLEWLVASPKDVAQGVVNGLMKGREEIYPTLNGKVFLRAGKWIPNFSVFGSRALLAKSFKDFLLNRYTS